MQKFSWDIVLSLTCNRLHWDIVLSLTCNRLETNLIIKNMWLLLTAIFMMVEVGHGRQVDIRKEVGTVLRQHNKERSSKQLKASDMLEMIWDDDLARQAGVYAERCRYQYPDPQEFDVGSNLYYEQKHVHGPKSIHRLVSTALKSWKRSKDYFVYSSHCESACSYAQMIVAQAGKIGCSLNTCTDLRNGDKEENFASIFVCFYSPRINLLSSFPYKTGFVCSECPSGSICRDGLCSDPGYEALPAYVQDSPSDRVQTQRQYGISSSDALTSDEKHYVTATHNRLRQNNNRDPVEWDPYLELWTDWIINCNVDYPGPVHSYTNFHRLDQGSQAYAAVYEWASEGDNTNLELDHGCRTPSDRTSCNHFTNILQPMLTSMACTAKDCGDNTRQFVCIYDNKVDREFRIPLQPYTSRRNRRNNRKRRFLNH